MDKEHSCAVDRNTRSLARIIDARVNKLETDYLNRAFFFNDLNVEGTDIVLWKTHRFSETTDSNWVDYLCDLTIHLNNEENPNIYNFDLRGNKGVPDFCPSTPWALRVNTNLYEKGTFKYAPEFVAALKKFG